ncbi:MAG: chemotaxis protein CheX [Candidatus Electryonea clarkiae]|nr:chemotaxis protein CheX [Candidatus Electryonea clarkiae]MDP8285629.1 chemotaxis protein CheX [Candidatus Electryonea clarkiae]
MTDEYVKPFVDALLSTIETMSGLKPTPQPFYIKGDEPTPGDVFGMIGITGRTFVGSIALIFPERLIDSVIQRMTGDFGKETISSMKDATTELANIVAGGGKRILAERGILINIALPGKIGNNLKEMNYGTFANVFVIPYDMEGDRFHMELMLKSIAA